MAWHAARSPSETPNEADRFRMEQGLEVGVLARNLYPRGILVQKMGPAT